MHYYSLLDLNREPFSNSPDPGLFYGSAQHTEILQKLEIAIRLKRGLNLILGEVGTGKTTLSRRLIRQLGRDSRTDCHLILDPGFESVSEFLAHIQILLSGKEVQGNDSRQKEAIKDHLFTADREVNKITVLIIDEGQKMTGGALEALRELLNFETNREKLLQIVIFAQNEFKPMLDRHENLKDRINFHYSLKNLSFTESKQLIRYRLNCCFVPGKEKHLFSVPALWVIHRFSNGSPRKMITLCHQVILAIIVREKKKADFFLARACARNALHSNEQPPLGRRLLAPVMIMLLMLMGGGYFWNQALHIPESSPPPVVIEKEIPVNREKAPPPRQPNPIKASVGIAPVAAPLPAPQSTENSENITDSGKSSAVKRTKGYGRATVPRDTTLYAMISRVYGRFSRPLLNTLMAANPQIKAPEQVKYGHRLFFPSPPENIPPEKGVYLVLRKTSQFEEAFALALSDKKTPMKLLTYPTGKTYEFFVVMDQTFPSLSAAREFAKHHLKTEKPIALEFPPVPEPQTTGQAS